MADSGLTALLNGVERIDSEPGSHRRRSELMDVALQRFGDREFAEMIYDIAEDENLDPAYAYELVYSGLAVCEPGPPAEAGEILVDAAPEWVDPPIAPPDVVERERRLRSSFRRVRHFIERCGTVQDAMKAFADEPDVSACGY